MEEAESAFTIMAWWSGSIIPHSRATDTAVRRLSPGRGMGRRKCKSLPGEGWGGGSIIVYQDGWGGGSLPGGDGEEEV